MGFFGYVPPPFRKAKVIPLPSDWSDARKVGLHENPWAAVRDNSKTVVTLVSSILALIGTFANSLIGNTGSGWAFTLMCFSWGFFVVSLAFALFAQFRLTSYLMGLSINRNVLIWLSNLSYFMLIAGLILLGISQYFRLVNQVPPAPGAFFRRLGPIGPFPLAGRTLCQQKTTDIECMARTAPLFDNLGVKRLPKVPDLIVLISSADRRSLSGPMSRSYDSNAGLARARAEWVQQALLARNPTLLTHTRFMTLYTGPRSTAVDATTAELDADRKVEVWAIATE